MKKFFEKYGLFKIVGIMILLVVLLSWIIPAGSFDGTSLTIAEDVVGVGLNDLATNGFLSLYYFSSVVTFLIILGGFYAVLNKTKGYQKLVDKVANGIKNNEILFVLIVSLLIAGITSISTDMYHIFVFIPFIVTVISRAKMDKFTVFATTFGSILVGIIGSTYSTQMFEYSNYYLGLTFASGIVYKLVLFVFSFALLNVFNVLHIKKTLSNKKNDIVNVDVFEDVKPISKRSKSWPLLIVLGLLLVIQILGFINWTDSFNVEVFANFNNWLSNIKIGEVPVVSRFFGTMYEFGQFQLANLSLLLCLAIIAIKYVCGLTMNDVLDSLVEGFKKLIKPIAIVLMIYSLCILSVIYPVMPTITNWITGLSDGFNTIYVALSGLISSTFLVEMRYLSTNIALFLSTTIGSEVVNPYMMIILQATYGFIQFVAPTSIILMFGLSYLNISYKDYLKSSWKFILGLFIGLVILVTVITLVL